MGVNSIKARGGCEVIDVAMDSGTSETVIGDDTLQSVQTREGEASKRGAQYEVANRARVPSFEQSTHTQLGGYNVQGLRGGGHGADLDGACVRG